MDILILDAWSMYAGSESIVGMDARYFIHAGACHWELPGHSVMATLGGLVKRRQAFVILRVGVGAALEKPLHDGIVAVLGSEVKLAVL